MTGKLGHAWHGAWPGAWHGAWVGGGGGDVDDVDDVVVGSINVVSYYLDFKCSVLLAGFFSVLYNLDW